MMYRVLLSPFFSSLFFGTCGTCVTGGIAAGGAGVTGGVAAGGAGLGVAGVAGLGVAGVAGLGAAGGLLGFLGGGVLTPAFFSASSIAALCLDI